MGNLISFPVERRRSDIEREEIIRQAEEDEALWRKKYWTREKAKIDLRLGRIDDDEYWRIYNSTFMEGH